jgi:hypothetical protein
VDKRKRWTTAASPLSNFEFENSNGLGIKRCDVETQSHNESFSTLHNERIVSVVFQKCVAGLAVESGVIPPEWVRWVHINMRRGISVKQILGQLLAKGFHPAKSPPLMQLLLAADGLHRAVDGDPEVSRTPMLPKGKGLHPR